MCRWGASLWGVAMLHPDRRELERGDERAELKVIACLSIILMLAVALVGVGLTTSLVWPAQAYPLEW
jgi:nitrate reductase NapE component